MHEEVKQVDLTVTDTATTLNLNDRKLGDEEVIRILQAHDSAREVIDLSGNEITNLSVWAVANFIKQQDNIREIRLGNNKIVFMPDLPIHITALNFLSNKYKVPGIELLSNAIKERSKTIQVLDLSGNNIKPENDKIITEIISNCENIVELDLSNNKILSSYGWKIAKDMALALKNKKSLKRIDISALRNDKWLNFLKDISDNENIRSVNLSWNKIDSKSAIGAIKWLVDKYHLTSLNLVGNNINPIVIDYINQLIDRNKKYLKSKVLVEVGCISKANTLNLFAWSMKFERSTRLKLSSYKNQNYSIDYGYEDDYSRKSEFIQRILNRLKTSNIITEVNLSGLSNLYKADLLIDVLAENNSITKLSLSNCSWYSSHLGEILNILKNKNNLTYLDISDIQVGSIYDDDKLQKNSDAIIDFIKKNKSVTHLNLSNNKIKEEGFASILEALQQNKVITTISLSNMIRHPYNSTLKSKLLNLLKGNKTITSIDLSFNHLGGDLAIGAIEALLFNDTLTEINLSSCNLDKFLYATVFFNKLKNVLRDNKTLKKIDLSGNGITDSQFIKVVEGIKENSGLNIINLSYNKISSDGAIEIARAISQNKNLSYIDLSLNMIGDRGGVEILKAVKTNTKLKEVNLEGNNISPKILNEINNQLEKNRLKNILEKIQNNDNEIKTLNLQNKKISDYGAIEVANALEGNNIVSEIDLSDNDISAEGCVSIINILAGNDNIKKLNLYNNNLGAIGVAALSELIKKQLNILDISFNNLEHKGIQNIVKAIEYSDTIKSLNISYNNIGDNGAITIADALLKNKTLNIIDLSYNNINYKGIDRVIRVLQKSNLIRGLNISGNDLGYGGATSVAKLLKNNIYINKINISNSNIDANGISAITDAIKQNKSLTNIDLSKNSIDDNSAIKLASAIKDTRNLQIINLDDNLINDNGAIAILNALENNFTVTDLSLNGNEISESIICKIAAIIKRNNDKQSEEKKSNDQQVNFDNILKQIQENAYYNSTVDLSNFNINDRNLEELFIALAKNQYIREINLQNNHITSIGASYILRALSINNNIININLNNNRIDDNQLNLIRILLDKNTQINTSSEHKEIENRPDTTLLDQTQKLTFMVHCLIEQQGHTNRSLGDIQIYVGSQVSQINERLSSFNTKLQLLTQEQRQLFNKNIVKLKNSYEYHLNFITTLKSEYDAKNTIEEKIKNIMNDPGKREYYMSVISGLNALFLAVTTIKSDLINHNQKNWLGYIGDVIGMVGDAAPYVGLGLKGVAHFVKEKDYTLIKEKLLNIANLAIDVTAMEEISRNVAIKLIDKKLHEKGTAKDHLNKMIDDMLENKALQNSNKVQVLVSSVENLIKAQNKQAIIAKHVNNNNAPSGCCVML